MFCLLVVVYCLILTYHISLSHDKLCTYDNNTERLKQVQHSLTVSTVVNTTAFANKLLTPLDFCVIFFCDFKPRACKQKSSDSDPKITDHLQHCLFHFLIPLSSNHSPANSTSLSVKMLSVCHGRLKPCGDGGRRCCCEVVTESSSPLHEKKVSPVVYEVRSTPADLRCPVR